MKSLAVALLSLSLTSFAADQAPAPQPAPPTTKVPGAPDGYHSLTPYLHVSDGAKMIEFYKKAFGAKELFRDQAKDGKLNHAQLIIGESVLMLGDADAALNHQSPKDAKTSTGMIYFYVADVDAMFKQAIAAGAKEIAAPVDMPWGDRVGRLSDPSGQEWWIATNKPEAEDDPNKGGF